MGAAIAIGVLLAGCDLSPTGGASTGATGSTPGDTAPLVGGPEVTGSPDAKTRGGGSDHDAGQCRGNDCVGADTCTGAGCPGATVPCPTFAACALACGDATCIAACAGSGPIDDGGAIGQLRDCLDTACAHPTPGCAQAGADAACKDLFEACADGCAPACNNKKCGDDGCGGSCGACSSGTVCSGGACVCEPACDGKQCGDDGCGGSCGPCAGGTVCVAGACVKPLTTCAAVVGCAVGCGDMACINDCYELASPDAKSQAQPLMACVTDQCVGDDAACAKEAITSSCKKQYDACISSCTPICGAAVCGSDGCGGSCGSCPAGKTCSEGSCTCAPSCAGKACGPDGCGGLCGACPQGSTCSGGACVCVPDCGGKKCGPDGCGGSCGSCPSGTSCTGGTCGCTQSCGGKKCGPDGCGGSCGSCPSGTSCTGGTCGCAPSCGGNKCGPDGCGGSCGMCPFGTVCSGGSCVCAPSCSGKQCGADGCGGSCGTCASGSSCSGGKCSCTKGTIRMWNKVQNHETLCYGVNPPVWYTQTSWAHVSVWDKWIKANEYYDVSYPIGTSYNFKVQCCYEDPCIGNLSCNLPWPPGKSSCVCVETSAWFKVDTCGAEEMNVCW